MIEYDFGEDSFQRHCERAKQAGAKGLKILKTLGLYLRENGKGALVKVDDKRFDPMWEACAALRQSAWIPGSRRRRCCRMSNPARSIDCAAAAIAAGVAPGPRTHSR